jgi:hypothetical protein
MPSRAEMRVRLERALRGTVIVALAVMLWQSLREQVDSGGQTVSARGIGRSALADWSSLPKAPGRIHVQLDSVPTKVERAWLGALAGAGTRVTWSGDLAPLMIDAQPIASPIGGTKLLIAAPNGSSVVMSDDVGVIDTVRAQNTGLALTLNSAPDQLTARATTSVASTNKLDPVVLRRVLVIGDAGWESKFVVAALEEEGWKVDAFIRVAPGVDVTPGPATVIDTSRYSAVVALDGAALPYANRIVEFVRTGGGLLLAPQAASLDAMTPVRAGELGRAASDAGAIQAGASVSLSTLALAPITSLRADAVPIEQRAGAVTIAARRIGAGRELQLGYVDTWRWRMGGGEGAVHDHRAWWTGLVSRVAYAPRAPHEPVAPSTDRAPMADLGAAIGPGTPSVSMSTLSGKPSDGVAGLFLLLALALIGEVASRRLRGES